MTELKLRNYQESVLAETRRSKPKNNLTGKKFGRIIVGKYDKGKWECFCSCGNITYVRTNSLTSGRTQSCGCLGKERSSKSSTKHGGTNTRLYSIWRNMKCRCSCPTASKYEIYGGKGIRVCDEWLPFTGFRDWALTHGYSNNLSIDRINSDGNYEPKNCRWVTYKVQGNNTKQNHIITYNNKTQTLAEWADELGFSYKVLSERIRRKWSIERAFNTPTQTKGEKSA